MKIIIVVWAILSTVPTKTQTKPVEAELSKTIMDENDSRPDNISKDGAKFWFYSGKMNESPDDISNRASLLVLNTTLHARKVSRQEVMFSSNKESKKSSLHFGLKSLNHPLADTPTTTSYQILSVLTHKNNSPLIQLDSNKTRIEDRRIDSVPYCSDPKAPCACDVISRVVGNLDENENSINEFVCNMEKTDLSIIPANFKCEQLFLKRKIKSLNKFVTLKSGCELRCIANCER